MQLIFRPIDQWPGEFTRVRKPARFSTNWSETLELLTKELDALEVNEAVIRVAADESAMRLDGGLRANATTSHPGVILTFDLPGVGPLQYATDVFDGGSKWRPRDDGGTIYYPGWQMNARAIALSLQALRQVDRYGVTKRGEQYSGWKQIGSGIPMPASSMTLDSAIDFILTTAEQADYDPETNDIGYAYRLAAKVLHPDAGGSTDEFQRLQEAKRLIDQKLD